MKKISMKKFASSLMAILGLSAWAKGDDGHNLLTDEQKAELKTYGFAPSFIQAFEKSLAGGFNEEEETIEANSEKTSESVLRGLLAQKATELAEALSQVQAMKAASETEAATLKDKETEIASLKEKVTALSKAGETVSKAGYESPITIDLSNDRQLMGMEGEMYAMDRPYNQRARAALLASAGVVTTVRAESSMDYSRLREDLGAFYRIPWMQRLQSFLTMLPSVESIFPLESGYQDLAVLVNVWLGEFSQAENTASDFDNVTKGNYEFDNETLRMHSVMFAHKFTNLKQLEKLWIGSLNREGSQAIKWSFIEYILAETAKKLHNERELRRINGVRREPDLNKPGSAMEASDGVYEFLRKKVDGYVDPANGKTVYQIKPFELGEITQANIGEKIYQGTGLIPGTLRDSGLCALYMPSFMVTMYHKYNETMYGQNQDYKAGIMYVKEYPSVRIIPVPNADNHRRIFWTMQGNIKTYEHVSGEMMNFSIEQQDWTLKVWSIWKESVWAQAVGYKYTKKEDMDYSRQMIFCNEQDRPETDFINAPKDANPSAAVHTSIRTVANTSLLTITDIEGAETGVPVTLMCGSVNKGVKIVKTENFSLLTADWEPAEGDTLKLMKRADGKFIELSRSTAVSGLVQFPADATAPSVADATEFVTGTNTQDTAITTLADAIEGVVYTINGSGSANATTIAADGNFVLTAAMTLSGGHFIKLVKAGSKFYEVARA